jgi:hypothetical protein
VEIPPDVLAALLGIKEIKGEYDEK